MSLQHAVLAAAGALLSVAVPAHAITVSGLDPNSSSYAVSASALAGDFSGVVELSIIRSDLGAGILATCSGSLLTDGLSILTAAHCIADRNGGLEATIVYVTFNLPNGASTTRAARFRVDPLFNGQEESPNDIAVLTLDAPAPAAATRYDLYTGSAINQTITLAGYGIGGTGAKGYDGAQYPFGMLRVGLNQYDAATVGEDLLFDFDDGLAANDALGSLGLGSAEAFIAPGDAGGPSFINGQVAGVHSFSTRYFGNGATADIDDILNSSFGEYAGDASVAYNAGFIQSVLGATPEPKTMFLVGVALVAISLMGSKRRQH